MSNHEDTLAGHLISNLAMAFDQVDEFTDPNWTAADAYAANAYQQMVEDGYSADEAYRYSSAFHDLWKELNQVSKQPGFNFRAWLDLDND